MMIESKNTNISFYKYHGAGNDFILIDNRSNRSKFSTEIVQRLCDRHFGIGADGLILLESSEKVDFRMIYFNADGHVGSMCGNGGRCIAAFAHLMGIGGASMVFEASDGLHQAEIISHDTRESIVKLEMRDVSSWQYVGEGLLVDTGSPHYIVMTDDLSVVDVEKQGRALRNNKSISTEGVNVDFLSIAKDKILLRTYERGVEAETLSCGTGATAAAIAASLKLGGDCFSIQTLGGELEVSFLKYDDRFSNIFLTGPATFVFYGKLNSDMF